MLLDCTSVTDRSSGHGGPGRTPSGQDAKLGARLLRRALLALSPILIASVYASAAPASEYEGLLGDLQPPISRRLGLAFPGAHVPYYDKIAEAGIGVVRLSAPWGRLAPSPGRYDWRSLDERVRGLQARGIEVFLTLESDAAWAVDPASRQKVKNGTPLDWAVWRGFCQAVAERYDGDGRDDMPQIRMPVRRFQVVNEWGTPNNRSGGWAGTTAQLLRCIDECGKGIRAADSRAQVVLGGLATAHVDVMINALGIASYPVRNSNKKGAWDIPDTLIESPKVRANIEDLVVPTLESGSFDVAAVHLYGRFERNPERIGFVRRFIGDKPMLSSECGGPSLAYTGAYRPEDHFFAVLGHNLSALSAGLDYCMWYHLGDHPGEHVNFETSKMGLFAEDRSPKPGFFAYKLLAVLLDGAQRITRAGSGNVYRIGYRDGSETTVAWGSPDRAEQLAMPSPGLEYDVLRVVDPVAGRYRSVAQARGEQFVYDGRLTVVGQGLARRFAAARR